jgi:hypothetical protein
MKQELSRSSPLLWGLAFILGGWMGSEVYNHFHDASIDKTDPLPIAELVPTQACRLIFKCPDLGLDRLTTTTYTTEHEHGFNNALDDSIRPTPAPTTTHRTMDRNTHHPEIHKYRSSERMIL